MQDIKQAKQNLELKHLTRVSNKATFYSWDAMVFPSPKKHKTWRPMGHYAKIEFPLPKGALCQAWLKLTQ